MTYGCTRVNIDAELVRAVKSGTLQVKDPLTFGPHTFPVGNALLSALVAVDDLRECVATRGLTVETAQPQATTPSPAHVVTDQTKSLEPASDGPAKSRLNKSEKTLIFEAKVLELTGKFWNDRTPGTEPTKSDLCKLVYDEILRTPIRGARKMTRSMVIDAAKPWRMPIVLPAMVPHSKFNDKRHPFKGER